MMLSLPLPAMGFTDCQPFHYILHIRVFSFHQSCRISALISLASGGWKKVCIETLRGQLQLLMILHIWTESASHYEGTGCVRDPFPTEAPS